jgi:hypothetical protein
MYIRAKLDPSIMEEYRKYWKANGVDYRCILEIKGKIEEVISDSYQYNIYLLRNELVEKFISALKDYAMKKMISTTEF